jgi:O-antigen/teichoic acid export membrane protein
MIQKIKSFLFKNTSSKQTVAKNTVWLSVSNFGGRIIKAVVVIYAARVLGTAGWGLFSYATTLAAFFTLCMDPGVNWIVMRDAGKAAPDDRLKIFSTTFILKLFLIAAGVAIVIFVAPFFSTLAGATALLPIAALIIAGDTIREFFSSFIRSIEKMEWEAGIFLLTNVAIVVFGFVFLMLKPTPVSFGWGYVVGTTIGAIAAMWLLRHYFKTVFSHFSPKLIPAILRIAWPFTITGALGLLLTTTDVLIVSWLRSASDVGIYSAAIRIIQIFYLVPTVIQFSTLPLFSRLAHKDNDGFRMVLGRIIGVIFLISVPLALGGAILGTQIMRLVFGAAYASGGLSFKILMITMLVDYPAMVISNAIFAYNHQKSLIVSSAIAGFSNVGLDLLLIPRFGIAGSAVATLIAQIACNAYLWHAMKKINYFEVLPKLGKIAIAGVVMGIAVTILFFAHVNVLLNVFVGALVYGLLLAVMREPLLLELKNIIVPRSPDQIS